MSQDLVAKALNALRQKDFATAQSAIAEFGQDNLLELQHYLIKGLAELSLKDWASAETTFTEAAGFFPHQAQLWLNLGAAQENLGKIDEAVDSLEHALALHRDQAEACGNLSNLYRKQGRFVEAEKMAHRAYELGAPKAQALNSLGLALGKQGKFDAAQKALTDAAQIDPTNREVTANLANLAIDQLKFDDAWPLFTSLRTLPDNATIRRDEGMARLLAGDYALGWSLYEARLELPNALRMHPTCPRYKGEPLAGKKLLIVAEQGLGDTIMFCRYGKFLAEQGAELFWMIPKTLRWVIEGNVPGKIIPENEPMPECDYYAPLMSLPLLTGKLDPAEIAWKPYLGVMTSMELPKAKEDKRKIGLVWAGSPTHERDHERSLLLDQMALLFTLRDTQLYAPFVGYGIDQIIDDTPVINLTKSINDFADTATILKSLDYLVSVDTAVAHMAGALGVKTLLLLPHCPDWRWGTKGTTTPWYPSVTLLRQPHYGDWDSVMGMVMKELG